MLPVRDMKTLGNSLPNNIVVIRAKSSWMTVELMIVLLEMLRTTMDAHKVRKALLLLLDCSPIHVHPRVWKAAKKYTIFLSFVPSCLTWLVQPLDVKTFRLLKACLRRLYKTRQTEQESSFVSILDLIRMLAAAICQVLQGQPWSQAFDDCGYGNKDSVVMNTINSLFSQAGVVNCSIDNAQPTEEEMHRMLPRKKIYAFNLLTWTLPSDSLLAPSTNEDSAYSMELAPAGDGRFPSVSSAAFRSREDAFGEDDDSDMPIAHRTRSRHSMVMEPNWTPVHPGMPAHPIGTERIPSLSSSGTFHRTEASEQQPQDNVHISHRTRSHSALTVLPDERSLFPAPLTGASSTECPSSTLVQRHAEDHQMQRRRPVRAQAMAAPK